MSKEEQQQIINELKAAKEKELAAAHTAKELIKIENYFNKIIKSV